MKLLSILNLSNREKPGCDSGVIFHRLLFSRLAMRGCDCIVASPIKLRIPKVKDIHFEVGNSKYDVRFRFDWEKLARILIKEQPEVLFAHQVELTSNFRALIVTLGLKTKLVTYCHYWPVLQISKNNLIEWDLSLNDAGLAEVILFRIFSAVKTSDFFFVTSEFSRRLLFQAARIYNVTIEKSKVHILPCPADPDFISSKPRQPLGTKQVLYNHRLYKQYGTEFFIDLVSHFENSGMEFMVTDFFSKRSALRKGLDQHVDLYRSKLDAMKNVKMRKDGHIRNVYKHDIVAKTDLGIGPLRYNANWSMGAVDCLGLGIPVICPNIASFPEFVPKELLFENKEEAIALINRLLNDQGFWKECSRKGQKKVKQFSADKISTKFLNVLNSSGA